MGGMQGTTRRRGHRLGSCFVHEAEHIGPQPLSTAKRKTDGGQTSTRARGQQDVRTEARRNSARALAPARAPRPGPQTGWARLLLLSLQFGARPPVTFPVTGDSPPNYVQCRDWPDWLLHCHSNRLSTAQGPRRSGHSGHRVPTAAGQVGPWVQGGPGSLSSAHGQALPVRQERAPAAYGP